MVRKNYLKESLDVRCLSDALEELTHIANRLNMVFDEPSDELDDLYLVIQKLYDIQSDAAKQAENVYNKLR